MVHAAQVGRGQAVGIPASRIFGTPQGQADGPAPAVGRATTEQPGLGGPGGQAAAQHKPQDQILVSVYGGRDGRRRPVRQDVRPRRLPAQRTGGGRRIPVRLAAVRKRRGRVQFGRQRLKSNTRTARSPLGRDAADRLFLFFIYVVAKRVHAFRYYIFTRLYNTYFTYYIIIFL